MSVLFTLVYFYHQFHCRFVGHVYLQLVMLVLVYELTIVISLYAGCRFEVTSNNRGEYNWPVTDAGNSTVLNCTFGGFNGVESTALRFCNASLQEWEDPNLDMCFTEVTSAIKRIGEVA